MVKSYLFRRCNEYKIFIVIDCFPKTIEFCFLGLLKVLVTKLRPMLFLSGDYVCKKGDVGKEMFIVTTGQVQVVGGPDDSIVFVTLGQGN